MKKGAFKKNDMGKWAIDFYGKKTVVKTANRKVRRAGKKACTMTEEG